MSLGLRAPTAALLIVNLAKPLVTAALTATDFRFHTCEPDQLLELLGPFGFSRGEVVRLVEECYHDVREVEMAVSRIIDGPESLDPEPWDEVRAKKGKKEKSAKKTKELEQARRAGAAGTAAPPRPGRFVVRGGLFRGGRRRELFALPWRASPRPLGGHGVRR